MNRVKFSKFAAAVILVLLSAVVINLHLLFPTSNERANDKTSAKSLHEANVKYRSSHETQKKRVIEKSYEKERVTTKKNYDREKVFGGNDPGEEQIKKTVSKHSQNDVLRSRNFADLSENLSSDVISGTHKTVTDDTVQGKKKKDQKGNNPNLKELKSESSCGYQVFSTTKYKTLL